MLHVAALQRRSESLVAPTVELPCAFVSNPGDCGATDEGQQCCHGGGISATFGSKTHGPSRPSSPCDGSASDRTRALQDHPGNPLSPASLASRRSIETESASSIAKSSGTPVTFNCFFCRTEAERYANENDVSVPRGEYSQGDALTCRCNGHAQHQVGTGSPEGQPLDPLSAVCRCIVI